MQVACILSTGTENQFFISRFQMMPVTTYSVTQQPDVSGEKVPKESSKR
jgi:hypothetical protein